jgi:hypothetical protein
MPPGRPRNRQEDNTKMVAKETGWKGVEWGWGPVAGPCGQGTELSVFRKDSAGLTLHNCELFKLTTRDESPPDGGVCTDKQQRITAQFLLAEGSRMHSARRTL